MSKIYSRHYKINTEPISLEKKPKRRIRYSPSKPDEILLLSKHKNPKLDTVNSSGPISPNIALQMYSSSLTPNEKKEILDYPEIFYIGKKEIKSISGITTEKTTKHYKAHIGDQIAFRYEILQNIGKGSFAQVLRCYDHKEKHEVALKVNALTKSAIATSQTEISIVEAISENLQSFSFSRRKINPSISMPASILLHNDQNPDSSNIKSSNSPLPSFPLGIWYNHFIFRGHTFFVTELLGKNLYELSKAHRYIPFSTSELQIIANDIFTALNFLHQLNIVHADVKPENILQSPDGHNKLIDFGNSFFVGHNVFKYLESRFYRAPEVIMEYSYDTKIDIWSAGCVLAELTAGIPLFPGKDEEKMIDLFVASLGKPPPNMIANSSRGQQYFTLDGSLIKPSSVKSIPLKVKIRSKNQLFVDLIQKCLVWDPASRISANDALKHPFFN